MHHKLYVLCCVNLFQLYEGVHIQLKCWLIPLLFCWVFRLRCWQLICMLSVSFRRQCRIHQRKDFLNLWNFFIFLFFYLFVGSLRIKNSTVLIIWWKPILIRAIPTNRRNLDLPRIPVFWWWVEYDPYNFSQTVSPGY